MQKKLNTAAASLTENAYPPLGWFWGDLFARGPPSANYAIPAIIESCQKNGLESVKIGVVSEVRVARLNCRSQ